METPWGWIYAKKEAKEHKSEATELQELLDKALKLLKMDNPDIELVIRILEEKGTDKEK